MKISKKITITALLLLAVVAGCKKQDEPVVLTVASTDPVDQLTGVPRNKVVAFTFSEAMDPATITTTTFTLQNGSTPVSGTVTYSDNTATFIPTSELTASTDYTATVTTGATAMTGNTLANNFVWHFTTGSSSVVLAAVNLGASGNYLILAKTTITNIAVSALTGDLGLSPAATSYITGFALTNATGYTTSAQVTGKLFAADMVAPTSTNLTTAMV